MFEKDQEISTYKALEALNAFALKLAGSGEINGEMAFEIVRKEFVEMKEIRENMMKILKFEEDKTDLENLAVLSRVGMKVASAFSSEASASGSS